MNESQDHRPAARTLADFAVGLHPEDIPTPVREKIRLLFLDTLGVMLSSYPMPFAAMLHDVAREMGGRPEATAVGFGTRMPSASAALVNASLGHGQDYDDTHPKSVTHPSSVVVAATLAMAERQEARGAEVLAAAAAGYEVITRIGAAAPGAFHSRGFHTTGICGPFGAAAVAGRLLGLDADRLARALGIVGSQAAGIGEFNNDGSWVKRLHPGWGAHSGIMAALLAQRGFTGPTTVLEGSYGLFRTHLGPGSYDIGRLKQGLGTEWSVSDIAVKLYPSCHHNHGPLDAVLELRGRHGITPEEVEEITCYVPEAAVPLVCEPLELRLAPPSPYAAQFSIQYCLAAAVVEGHALSAIFSEEKIRDPRILDLTRRVRYQLDPESPFPAAYGGAVDVVLKDGRAFHHRVAACKGSPQNPASLEEIIAKFQANVRGILAPEAAGQLIEAVLHLDSLNSLAPIGRLCNASDVSRS